MDIYEQVNKLLRDMETRERTGETDLCLARAALLAELAEQYKQCVIDRQWKYSYYCLVDIFQLVGDILAEAAGK